jgi:hypothetical protein
MVHAFVPQHLIDFAEFLKSKDFSDENYDLQCIHRTIINRAYLSTYLHTKEWILNNGSKQDIRDYSKKPVGYHTAICIALEKLNKRHISLIYDNSIKLRVDADYNIVTIIDSDDAQRALDLAYQIQNALQ